MTDEWKCPDCGYAAAISVSVTKGTATCKLCSDIRFVESQIKPLVDELNALVAKRDERNKSHAG